MPQESQFLPSDQQERQTSEKTQIKIGHSLHVCHDEHHHHHHHLLLLLLLLLLRDLFCSQVKPSQAFEKDESVCMYIEDARNSLRLQELRA
jgi:hypothetical protein